MSEGHGSCPSGPEIEVLASASVGDSAAQKHVRECAACREKLENLKFERQFAEALNAGARGGGSIPLPVLPGYEVLREVSRGGQGIVYEAVQQRTNRRVALKVLRQDHGISRTQRARFEREIEIAAALQHPGIVGVYDSIGMAGGQHALVLEYVEGVALDVEEGRGTPEQATLRKRIELIAQVCDAIHYAHQRGVIHRDLKPSNILVDKNGCPRLLDFGVACWSGGAAESRARITLTGEFAGTLAYAAPEQVSGVSGPGDLRTDLYAIGVMLYQLSFGRLPYDVSGSLETAIRNISSAEPTRIGRGAVDEDLWTIIAKAMSKEADRRYQSGAAMGADLRRYLGGETIEARRDSKWYVIRKSVWKHRVGVGVIAGAVAGLVAFGVVVSLNNAKLTQALRTSTFERARALGAAGSRPEADLMLWPELLRLGSALEDPARALFQGSAQERKVLWAFAEMQGAEPCLASMAYSVSDVLFIDAVNDRVASVSTSGWFGEWAIPDLRPIAQRRVFGGIRLDLELSAASGLCVAFDGGSLICINTSTGVEVGRRHLTTEARATVRFNQSGSVAAAWSPKLGLHAFQVPSFRPVFSRDRPALHSPWLSAGGDRIGVVNESLEVELFDLPGGQQRESWPLRFPMFERPPELGWIQHLQLSEDGELQALVAGHHLLAGQTRDREVLQKQSVSGGSVVSSRFSSSGEWLLTRAGSDPVAKLFRTGDWVQVAEYSGHAGEVRGAVITPDERHVITADSAGVIRVWPGPRAEVLRVLPDSAVKPHDVAIDSVNRVVYAAGSDGRVGRWLLDGSAAPDFVRADPRKALTVAASEQLGLVAAAGEQGSIAVFGAGGSPQRVVEMEAPDGISSLRFSPDGRFLAASGRYGPIAIYDTSTWALSGTIQTDIGRIVMIRWSPDGTKLAAAGASQTGRRGEWGICAVYGLESLKSIQHWDAHPLACRAVEFSPDGQLLATTGNDGLVRLHAVRSWEAISEIRASNSTVFCLAFHEAGQVLAAGDRSGRVSIIGLPEAKLLAHMDLDGSIMAMGFSGDQLVTAQLDKSITVRDFGMIARCIIGNRAYWTSRLEARAAEE